MRVFSRWWFAPVIFILVIIFLAIAGIILEPIFIKEPVLPEGWKVIRPPYDVNVLVIKDDIVWAGGRDGLFKIDRITGELLNRSSFIPSVLYVWDIIVSSDGLIWIGHQNGLTSYDGENYITYTDEDFLPDKRVNCLLEDREGRLWAGTGMGALYKDGKEWKVLTKKEGLLHDTVKVIFQDSYGGMWFGSYAAPEGGISCLKDGRWQYFNTDSGLPHNNIVCFLEDCDRQVRAGMGFYDRGGSVTFGMTDEGWAIKDVLTKEDGLAGEKVRSIYQDRDGVLWFGSEYDGLAMLKDGEWKVLTIADGLSHNEPKDIIQDCDGNMWIGTRNGITFINLKALKKIY